MITKLAELERALREDPDDAELALVYADAVGGERGEHIVLANLAAPTPEQQRRERALRQRLAMVDVARVTWRGGFVDRLDVDMRADDVIDHLRDVLAQPELIRLRAIDVRCGWADRPKGVDVATIAALVRDKPLRWFGIGTANEPLDVEALPAVRGLALAGTKLDVSKLDVVDLEVPSGTALPRHLERLVIAGADDGDLVRYEHLPLRAFGLVGGDDAFNDAFLARLVASPLFAKLEAVGFTVHRYAQSNRFLVENKAKFAHVKFFTAPRWEGGWQEAWHDLAHLYETLGRHAEALAEFDALVTLSNNATHWADIGVQLAALERREEALAAHDRAIALDVKNTRAWSGRASLLEDAEQFAEALVAWDAGQAAGLADVHTWTHRAWTLMRLDRNEEAMVALDAALKLDPKHEWSLKEKKRLRSIGHRARGLFVKLLTSRRRRRASPSTEAS